MPTAEEIERRRKISDYQKTNTNSGRFKRGERRSVDTEFKKGQTPWTKLNKGKYQLQSYNLTEEGREQKIKNLGFGMLGKKQSEYQKQKMRIIGMSKKGKIIVSEETRRKISEGLKGKMPKFIPGGWNKGKNNPNWMGEKNPNWTGGKTSLINQLRKGSKYKIWRELVFARDNYTCQECGQIGGYLEAHHKNPFYKFPELRFEVSNGITYCIDCHMKMDIYRAKFKEVH